MTTTQIQTTRRQAEIDLTDAVENLHYYKRQVAVRTRPEDIANAKGLVSAWTTTVAARRAKLEEINQSEQ